MSDRPDDRALWNSVATTLRNVVLPAVDDAFARSAVIQLVGLAQYAVDRGDDPGEARRQELAGVLDGLTDNPLVAPHWPASDPLVAAASVLASAASPAAAGPAAEHVRNAVRSILIRHLDDDLAETAVLGGPFRGRLPDA